MFNKKKAHFKQMLKDINVAIWELELKKFTLLNSRENYRQQYDKASEVYNSLKDKEDAKDVQVEAAQKEVKRTEKILFSLDRELVGGEVQEPSEDFPEGLPRNEGIDNQLQQWVDRREIAKHFIKHNC